MNTFVFIPLANTYKNLLIDLETGINYSKIVLQSKYMDAEKAMSIKKQAASAKINSLLDTIIEFFKKVPTKAEEIGQFLIKLGKGASIIILGLIIAPFYLAAKGGKYLYDLGEEYLNKIIQYSGIKYDQLKSFANEQLTQMKEVVGQLKEVPGEVKKGYQSVQKVPVRENYKHILPFDKFNS